MTTTELAIGLAVGLVTAFVAVGLALDLLARRLTEAEQYLSEMQDLGGWERRT